MSRAYILFAMVLHLTSASLAQTKRQHLPTLAVLPAEEQSSKRNEMSFTDVQKWIGFFRDGIKSLQQVVDAIKGSIINFPSSQENMDELRKSGANDAILEAIRMTAPAPPPPSKPVVRTGTLSIGCTPADCDVKINGQLLGRTIDGTLERSGLNVGEVAVDFEKDGFLTQHLKITITPEPASRFSVTLEPNNATKLVYGTRLLTAMLKALGVESNPNKLSDLTGEGAITSFTSGKRSDLDFNFNVSPPTQMEMMVKNLSGSLVYQCIGEKCEERKQGIHFPLRGAKQLRGPIVEELETNLRAFLHYNLIAVIQTIRSSSVLVSSATDPDGTGTHHLHAEATDIIYDLALDPNKRPSAVTYESKAGLGSGVTITFGDYVELAGSWYPKRTSVRLSDAEQHGIEVRLDKVSAGSNLQKEKTKR